MTQLAGARKIAVLHTSFVFVSVEPIINELLAELLPDATIVHFVDSDVLATVQRENGISEASTLRMVHLAEAAEAAGAELIFSACSSLGPALDVASQRVSPPIIKIDDAMTRLAAERADRVGILATVPTTLGPTADLVAGHARELGRAVTIVTRLAAGAFETLVGGDREAHDAMVLEQATALAADVDLIVLAQASMARLAERLEQVAGVPVLSSPRLGVGQLADRFHRTGGR
jgi:Asp/Glu/hydantoin racemase